MDQSLYSVLRVNRLATDAQIRAAYRLRALQTHPDKGGNEEEFLKVVEAFEILSDLPKRKKSLGRRAGLIGTTPSCNGPAAKMGARSRDPGGSCDGCDHGLTRKENQAAQAAAAADVFGLPDLGQTEPNQQPCEGHSAEAEALRAKALWLELLEKSSNERQEQLRTLSCRTAEVLLHFAKSQLRGAPVVAANEPQGCGNALLAAGPEVPEAKRAKLEGARACFERGARAHVCLRRMKVCTGASEDVAEAINWHILLVRVKQIFDEHLSAGDAFCAAAREALRAARAEAQPLSDPRLRFVTEVAVGDEVLFTPVSWDLEVGLRHHEELSALLKQHASREQLVEAIGRMMAASKAENGVGPKMEEKRLFHLTLA
ncbi:DnaJ homolog subfamily B member 2 (DnaJ homolog subfamily B member 10) (mDj8) [Durusdinium trenchii]|uniref:DnaJ homolog subfamily B member 2 (DnaJ homolog subfamily B member 10) (MDj8) n=1 Tax=Durusdinium trenchii TaxID=1381693 RepID=A0ABP0Q9Y8_9DINO